jgi:hypothetical protein
VVADIPGTAGSVARYTLYVTAPFTVRPGPPGAWYTFGVFAVPAHVVEVVHVSNTTPLAGTPPTAAVPAL